MYKLKDDLDNSVYSDMENLIWNILCWLSTNDEVNNQDSWNIYIFLED